MKKYVSIGVALLWLCLLGAFLCKKNASKIKSISSEEITNLVQDTLTKTVESDITTITVGYYEENCPETRESLRLLEKLGAVNYQSEEIFDNSKTSHVFVEVSLTAEGEKYIYNVPKAEVKEEIDVDMVNRYAKENEKSMSVDSEIVVAVNPLSAKETYTVTMPKAKEPAKYASELVSKELSLYELAKAHESKTDTSVLCQQRTIFKVRNIECDVELALDPAYEASAEVIVERSIVTPFGVATNNGIKGEKMLYKCKFSYENGAWKLKSFTQEASSEDANSKQSEASAVENAPEATKAETETPSLEAEDIEPVILRHEANMEPATASAPLMIEEDAEVVEVVEDAAVDTYEEGVKDFDKLPVSYKTLW